MNDYKLNVRDLGDVDVAVDERGRGAIYLLLHGGGGPAYIAAFAELLGAHGRVLAPTHPGFGGTTRPPALRTVRDLAQVYAALLDAVEARDVVVVGNSLGGWIASELALVSTRIARLVLVDAVGIEVDGHAQAIASELTPAEVAQRAFHDLSRAAGLTPPTAADAATSEVYAGPKATDPTLRARLSEVKIPTVVLWGESDRIVDTVYGRAYADAFPHSRFELLPQAGHMPQLETPDLLLEAVLRA